jgi:HAMP domain-containing protein
MDQIEDDLVLLREAGEGDIADEFLRRFDRVGQLEQEVERLRAQVEEQDG